MNPLPQEPQAPFDTLAARAPILLARHHHIPHDKNDTDSSDSDSSSGAGQYGLDATIPQIMLLLLLISWIHSFLRH
jgi:hypothetical protein